MNDNPEIRYLGDVQRLALEPGDIVVISVDQHLSSEASERIARSCAQILSDRKIMILEKGMKIGVLAEKDAV